VVRLLAVADSDSYLKWTAATVAALPSDWQRQLVVLATPITPSAEQVVAAAGAPVPVVTAAGLVRRLLRYRPDVLLLGCTGPVVSAVLLNPLLRAGRRRPVLVTGLPGISIPASARAVRLRAACDLFVVHSRRERADFAQLAEELGHRFGFALARLPFLPDGTPAGPRPVPAGPDADVVFAAQAKVPLEREQRRQVLLALAAAPGRAVVKLRAVAGEQQTHRELWAYPELWAELVAEGRVVEGSVRFSAGAMSAALSDASAFVTVSSTAALEAMAAGIPTLVLSDFGVSAELINVVFEGSGCLGTLDDLRAGRFFRPDPQWCEDNYFHRPEESDWLSRVEGLLAARAAAGLAARPLTPAGRPVALARRQLRLLLPERSWRALRRFRRMLPQRG
jgi:hypothetical protein